MLYLNADNNPAYNCPGCDRPTLRAVPDEVVDWRCTICGQHVREVNP